MFAFLANMQAAKYDDVTVDGVKYRAITDSTADASIAKEQPVITNRSEEKQDKIGKGIEENDKVDNNIPP